MWCERQFSGDEVAKVNVWLNDKRANRESSKVAGVSSYQGQAMQTVDIKDAGLMVIYSDNQGIGQGRSSMRVFWSEEQITHQLISAGLIESEVQTADSQ